MENVEGQKALETEVKAEEPTAEVESQKELLDRIKSLESTNDRLLNQSKEHADRWRTIRDQTEAREKEELLQQENYKGLLSKKEQEFSELSDNYKSLKKVSLKKDLDFNVARLIDKPLANGASIDDVIEQVLKTGIVEVTDDDNGFINIEEAYNKVKESKAFLFDSNKAKMMNAVPSNNAPQNKKLTSAELFQTAIQQIAKK